MQLTFRSNNGPTYDLTDYLTAAPNAATYYLENHKGLMAPDIDVYSEHVAALAGARWNGSVDRERTVSLAFTVRAASYDAALQSASALNRDLRAGGYLEATIGGLARRLAVQLKTPAWNDSTQRVGHWPRCVPELLAFDPYFYAASTTEVPIALADVTAGLQFPLAFPLLFQTPGVEMNMLITGGDAPSPWRLRLNGPFTLLTLNNYTAAEQLQVSYPVLASQSLLIDTTGQTPTVLLDRSGGTDPAPGYGLSAASTFWLLAPGTNVVGLAIAGGSGNNSGLFSYTKRYLGLA